MAVGQAHPAGSPALLRSAIVSIAAVLLVLGVAAPVVGRALGLGPVYVVTALAGFLGAAGLILSGLPAHQPFETFGPGNGVTLVRVAVLALLAGLLGAGATPNIAVAACALGTVAAVLDAVDGRLARASGMASRFGARFDLETDAALVMILALLAWQLGKAGPWVLASGLARYAFVAAGQVWTWLRRPLAPSFRRKAVAAVQMAVLVAALAPLIPPRASALLAAAALAVLCWSFATDLLALYRRSKEEPS